MVHAGHSGRQVHLCLIDACSSFAAIITCCDCGSLTLLLHCSNKLSLNTTRPRHPAHMLTSKLTPIDLFHPRRAHEADAGQYCPPPDQPPCSTNATACADCHVCLAEMPGGRPDLDQYQAYLPWFLQSVPSEGCAKGGAGGALVPAEVAVQGASDGGSCFLAAVMCLQGHAAADPMQQDT